MTWILISLVSAATGMPVLAADLNEPPGGRPALKPTHTNCLYTGVVTQITPAGITIDGKGDRPDGPDVHGVRTFAPTATLRAGGYELRKVYDVFTYRWADVKVGDRVEILFDVVGGVDVCACIAIAGRPGGQVPPAPGVLVRRARARRHNDVLNARQASEEKGIPLPDKFLSAEELEARKARTAPMPRLVKPRLP